jgi:hypothetical protein
VFVAQKNGIVKVFSSVLATTSTTFADLRPQVDDYTIGAANQDIGKRAYQFVSWSDGKPAVHTIVVAVTSKYTATFKRHDAGERCRRSHDARKRQLAFAVFDTHLPKAFFFVP